MSTQRICRAGALILALFVLVPNAGAFTAEYLGITIGESGDAHVEFRYRLDWYEHVVVFLRIVDPAEEFRSALEEHSGREVLVERVDAGLASFEVQNFAQVQEADGCISYRTPGISFAKAREALDRYWFAPFISADLSPEETVVSFPDGCVERYQGSETLPPLEHVCRQRQESGV